VNFSTIIYVAAACFEVIALVAGMLVVLTDLYQFSNVHNTCCVIVICFLSMSGVLSGDDVS
jgi:hypothetical protein